MCSVDDGDYAQVWQATLHRARKHHQCGECNREIQAGELYERWRCLYDSSWSHGKVCLHCKMAGIWLDGWCGGWLRHNLSEELGEHWSEGYRTIQLGRALIGFQRRWNGGTDPLPVFDRRAWPSTAWGGKPLDERLEAALAKKVEWSAELAQRVAAAA